MQEIKTNMPQKKLHTMIQHLQKHVYFRYRYNQTYEKFSASNSFKRLRLIWLLIIIFSYKKTFYRFFITYNEYLNTGRLWLYFDNTLFAHVTSTVTCFILRIYVVSCPLSCL